MNSASMELIFKVDIECDGHGKSMLYEKLFLLYTNTIWIDAVKHFNEVESC